MYHVNYKRVYNQASFFKLIYVAIWIGINRNEKKIRNSEMTKNQPNVKIIED